MGSNQFAETLVEVMLSWMRLLVDWIWSIFRSGAPTGITSWFANHWLSIVVVLIVGGVVVDWLVWMIRWRPYWLWFRKTQIIYEDEEKEQKPRPQKVERPQNVPHFRGARSAAAVDDFEDPFAESAAPAYSAPAPKTGIAAWEADEDPYAAHTTESTRMEIEDWDGGEDPYAQQDRTRRFMRPRKK